MVGGHDQIVFIVVDQWTAGDPVNKIVVGQAYYLIEGLVECQAAGRLEPVDYPVDRSINV